MEILDKEKLKPFITKDNSEIREYHHSQSISLAEASLKPGQEALHHLHKLSLEIYYILEGKGLMEIEGEKEMVSKDQAILIPPGRKHRIKNIGNEQLRLLCFCCPPYSDENTILIER